MNRIPYSRVVDVNLNRNDRFPSQQGFGTGLVLTAVEVAGVLDADNRTKVYSTLSEVAADHDTESDFYAQANVMFAQNPSVTRVKAGFVGVTVGAVTAAELKTELDAIADADNDFYAVLIPATMRDIPALDGLVEWTEARSKLNLIDSNDPLVTDAGDATNIAARHKGTVERTAVFWHDDANEYLAAVFWSYMTTRVFDQANSAYTLKFKRAKLVSPSNIGSADLTAVTGFVEAIGQSVAAGHCANAYVDIGGLNVLVEGSTLTANVFIDEVHATDYIVARTEEKALALFANEARIPYTDAGMQQVASVARAVMTQGVRAGIVADDIDPLTGDYAPSYEVEVPSVFDVPESQRKARVSPAIGVRFRYAGAVHYTTINFTMTF